jgi:hypothetical protein
MATSCCGAHLPSLINIRTVPGLQWIRRLRAQGERLLQRIQMAARAGRAMASAVARAGLAVIAGARRGRASCNSMPPAMACAHLFSLYILQCTVRPFEVSGISRGRRDGVSFGLQGLLRPAHRGEERPAGAPTADAGRAASSSCRCIP